MENNEDKWVKSGENVWMPYREYLLREQMLKEMDVEQYNRMKYFFWNNYSYEGYEEWKQKSIENNEKSI